MNTSSPAAASPEIPQSSALSEASVESLTELMSRDPEGYKQQDILRIIEAHRAQRKKWEEMEQQAAQGKGEKKEKTRADQPALLKRASGTAEDMGL